MQSFYKTHLDYGDVAFDQAFNNYFHQRYKSIQYIAALAITRTSKKKLYQELGFESLQARRWFGKLSLLYKIIKSESPSFLCHLIPSPSISYSTRNSKELHPMKANHSFFKKTFKEWNVPSTNIEWNKLGSNICSSPSYKLFRKHYSISNVPKSLGITYLVRLHVGFSHLREHKFHNNFWDSLNIIRNCSNSVESTKHYLFRCSNMK